MEIVFPLQREEKNCSDQCLVLGVQGTLSPKQGICNGSILSTHMKITSCHRSPTQDVSCMSKEKFGQLSIWDVSTSEIY